MNMQQGGDVIGSGGFGCVFAPALKCASGSYNANMISKLMLKKHAIDEHSIIAEIKKRIEKIPNYGNYFLVDNISLCKPSKIPQPDLHDYSENCGMLERYNITAKNMNSNLDKLMLMNMPRGGISIDDYFEKHINMVNANFATINNNLIRLLENGVTGMNRRHIYHCDLKGSNVLLDDNLVPRIIDWGLSNTYQPNDIQLWSYYSVQFNTPFSSVFFGEHFKKWVNKHQPSAVALPEFMREFVVDYMAKQRHFDIINSIFYMFYMDQIPANIKGGTLDKCKKWVLEHITIGRVSQFLLDLVQHFRIIEGGAIKDASLLRYLNGVYIHLVDIWGFIMTYLVEIELLYQNFDNLNKQEFELFERLKGIFIRFLYTPQTQPIKVSAVAGELRKLNGLFGGRRQLHSQSTLSNYSSYRKMKHRVKKAYGYDYYGYYAG